MLPENKGGLRQGPVTREDPSPDEVYREMAAKGLISEENESSQPSQSPDDKSKTGSQL